MSRIRQIVHFHRMMKRWKSLSLRARTVPVSRSDEDSTSPVRAGYIAIHIGLAPDYRRRFVIPLRFINFPVFLTLLKNTEEEIGIQPTGALVVVCEVEFFRTMLELLENDEERFKGMGIEGFQDFFARYGGSGFESESSCKEEYACRHYSSFSPLLRKARV